MAVNPQDTEGLEDETVSVWQAAEDALIGVLAAAARVVSRRSRSPEHARQVAAQQMVETIRPRTVAVSNRLQQQTPALVDSAMVEAVQRGVASARTEVEALATHMPTSVETPEVPTPTVTPPGAPPRIHLPHTTPQVPSSTAALAAARRAADAAKKSLGTAARNIPRNTTSAWDRIIDDAVNKTVTGDLTIRQAMQQAMDDAARQGIGFYRDNAGRKWGLDTYSEMAIRTGTNNALIDAHTATLVEIGIDLVIVSSHRNPAPQCAPYERKILSLTGEHSAGTHRIDGHTVTVKDTLNGARSHGLHHPNCRHTVTAYLPGFTDTTMPAEDHDHEGYKATQQQRRLEREIRRSRRMEQAAITPESKAKAIARRKNYETQLREHIRAHDLPRRRHREQLRGPTDHK